MYRYTFEIPKPGTKPWNGEIARQGSAPEEGEWTRVYSANDESQVRKTVEEMVRLTRLCCTKVSRVGEMLEAA